LIGFVTCEYDTSVLATTKHQQDYEIKLPMRGNSTSQNACDENTD